MQDEERRQIIEALIEMRNKLLAQGKYTDAVDDVLCKMAAAKRKKIKIMSIMCFTKSFRWRSMMG